jgi:hypothetical protein
MNLIIATHEHRHGVSTHLFKTPLLPEEFPSEKAMARILDMDFEPDRGETLEFLCIDANYQIDEFDHCWRQVQPEPIDDIEFNDDPNSPDALRDKYENREDGSWGEHPDWPMSEWAREAGCLDTRIGYWEWVSDQLETAEGK